MNDKVKERTVFELKDVCGDELEVSVDPSYDSHVVLKATSIDKDGDATDVTLCLDYATWIALCDLRYRVQVKDPDERSCGTCYRSWRAGQAEKHSPDCALKAEKQTRAPNVGVDLFKELSPSMPEAQMAKVIDKSYWTGERQQSAADKLLSKKADETDDDVPF